ncbi:photosystem II reaction center protein PsbZ [Prochlorococcus marinus]|uniref:photosystem II reaction center protein PsbZ n=1 Tax=Prochlorococcus marinus TaxID=1219 RepID=UPI0022B2E590|nr:photosystem II reaction center protein PsbZ [Prochlorococcus marinus]
MKPRYKCEEEYLKKTVTWDNYWIREFSASSTMLAINSIVANALLFSSLLLVIGVPVFYMTQTNPEDNRNPNIKKIEILAGVWFHLVLLQALVGEYITHQMSV